MGQEPQAEQRRADFAGLPGDRPGCWSWPHRAPSSCTACPPSGARRSTARGRRRPRSRVWPQATNRMHAARGLLLVSCSTRGGPEAVRRRTVEDPAPAPHRPAAAEQPVSSQAQLVDLLGADGIVATQATVSRDLDELGAIKVRVPGGELVYAIPELPTEQMAPQEHLRRVLGDWAVAVNPSGNLVLLRTPPGSAHVVASAPRPGRPRGRAGHGRRRRHPPRGGRRRPRG